MTVRKVGLSGLSRHAWAWLVIVERPDGDVVCGRWGSPDAARRHAGELLCYGHNVTIAVDQAHAEARILSTAAKVLGVRLDHARLTGRLEQGSDALPDVSIARAS